MRSLFCCLLPFVLAACGSSKSTSNTGSGNNGNSGTNLGLVNGSPYVASSAWFIMETNTVQNANNQTVEAPRAFITLSNTPNYCDDFNNNVVREDETLVFIFVTDSNITVQDGNNIPTFTGNWNIVFDSDPSVGIGNSDAQYANCLSNPNNVIYGHGETGALSITSATATSLDINFSATLDTMEQATGTLQGSVTAKLCPALAQDGCTRHYVCNSNASP